MNITRGVHVKLLIRNNALFPFSHIGNKKEERYLFYLNLSSAHKYALNIKENTANIIVQSHAERNYSITRFEIRIQSS